MKGTEQGSNPFAAKRLQREQANTARCEHYWVSMDREVHRCDRDSGHKAHHGCACGATKKPPMKKKRKPVAKREAVGEERVKVKAEEDPEKTRDFRSIGTRLPRECK